MPSFGHQIDIEGIHPLEDKLKVIVQTPARENIQGLCSFLDLIIRNAATILVLLNALLPMEAEWQERQCSFNKAKATLGCIMSPLRWPVMRLLTVSEP